MILIYVIKDLYNTFSILVEKQVQVGILNNLYAIQEQVLNN